MAGFYADYPNNRIAYHLDGTQVYLSSNGGTPVAASGATITALNDEANTRCLDQERDQVHRLYFLFPEKRDITAYFYHLAVGGDPIDNFYVRTSVDTTNGIDGTWVTTGATGRTVGGPNDSYRTGITAMSSGSGIVGIEFFVDADFSDAPHLGTIHLFGKTTAGENPNRLELWHPTLDQRLGAAALDWGNAKRSTTDTRTFRVKNHSATLTANSIVVSLADSTDSSPSFTDAHDLSFGGGGYAATQNIGNLAPGAISGVVTVRRTFSSTQPLSVWAAIVQAAAGSWT